MNKFYKVALAVTLSSFVLTSGNTDLAQAQSSKILKPMRQSNTEVTAMVRKTLNSFYKPALNGRFPGSMNKLKIGVSTRQDVTKLIGQPDKPRTNADGFDVFSAEMGHSGYAIAYKLNKIREMRYFGTNIERETNIGGITKKILFGQWGTPSNSIIIRNGTLVQQKVTYNRGNYKLAFIFNTSTNLDHINLLKR